MSLIPGTRCRSVRNIIFRGGIVRRATPGTLVSRRENLGRQLFTVKFDSGENLILFAHEIEPVNEISRRSGPSRSSLGDTASTPTALGIEDVDIPIARLQAAPIRFTFFWPVIDRWEGHDFQVDVRGIP